MKVWLPAIHSGTGTDVFTVRLAKALVDRGIDAEITWFSRVFEFFPEMMRFTSPPADTDIIHVNAWAAVAFLGSGIPVVTTVHHLVHDPAFAPYRSTAQAFYHRWHLRHRDARAIRRSAVVTAVTPYVASTVTALFGRQDVQVVSNWVDTSIYRPAEEALPRILLKELPNFMQPRVIHWRDVMPVSPNGKLDRTGLYQELTA